MSKLKSKYIRNNYARPDNDIVASIISLCVIITLHPLISLVLLSLINIFTRLSNKICYLYCLVYSILIVNREYLIEFNERSGDDTFRYIPFIKNIATFSFDKALTAESDIFSIEPLSRAYWWLLSVLGVNINVILLLQVFCWTTCLMVLAIKISERYAMIILCIGICFFSYTIPYTFFHLFRQAWGLSFFILYLCNWDKPGRFAFILLAGLSHLMFIPLLIFMEISRKGILILTSKYFPLLAAIFLIALYLTYNALLTKIGMYSEGENINYSPFKSLIYSLFFFSLLMLYNKYEEKIFHLSNIKFNISLTLISFYLFGLYIPLADIVNRYILLLSPLVIMFLTITKSRFLLLLFLLAALIKLSIHLFDVDGNIYQFTMRGYLDFYNVMDALYFYLERKI
ncbi:O41 family O-antigen polymerase [Escherichia coli]|uniref:O41 family O-antigen polymerase n=1 Tax=Escherichia coli TaxID=562 RepID=UPI0021D4EAF4|nr:O41 family O-antigen polymerase [Escherichia coli]MCU6830741.1 O41 family O-antigen polymerase [Escherichia coli]